MPYVEGSPTADSNLNSIAGWTSLPTAGSIPVLRRRLSHCESWLSSPNLRSPAGSNHSISLDLTLSVSTSAFAFPAEAMPKAKKRKAEQKGKRKGGAYRGHCHCSPRSWGKQGDIAKKCILKECAWVCCFTARTSGSVKVRWQRTHPCASTHHPLPQAQRCI